MKWLSDNECMEIFKTYDGDMSKAAYMVNDKITIAFHANEKLCSMMDNEED